VVTPATGWGPHAKSLTGDVTDPDSRRVAPWIDGGYVPVSILAQDIDQAQHRCFPDLCPHPGPVSSRALYK
jgi:hypothetical protein